MIGQICPTLTIRSNHAQRRQDLKIMECAVCAFGLPDASLSFPAIEVPMNLEITLERRRSVPVCDEIGYIGRTRSAHENSPREWAVRIVCGVCIKVIIFTIMFKRSVSAIVATKRLSFPGISHFERTCSEMRTGCFVGVFGLNSKKCPHQFLPSLLSCAINSQVVRLRIRTLRRMLRRVGVWNWAGGASSFN